MMMMLLLPTLHIPQGNKTCPVLALPIHRHKLLLALVVVAYDGLDNVGRGSCLAGIVVTLLQVRDTGSLVRRFAVAAVLAVAAVSEGCTAKDQVGQGFQDGDGGGDGDNAAFDAVGRACVLDTCVGKEYGTRVDGLHSPDSQVRGVIW